MASQQAVSTPLRTLTQTYNRAESQSTRGLIEYAGNYGRDGRNRWDRIEAHLVYRNTINV